MRQRRSARQRLATAVMAAVVAGTMAGAGGVAGGQEPDSNNTVQGPRPGCGSVPGVDDKCEAWSAYWDNQAAPILAAHTVGANGGDWAAGIAVSPDGVRTYQVGTTNAVRTAGDPNQPNGDPIAIYPLNTQILGDVVTVARDTDGHELWEALYIDRRTAKAIDVEISPDGREVYTLVLTQAGLSMNFGLVAYDAATGDELWRSSYTSPDDNIITAHSMDVSPNGDQIYVVGQQFQFPGEKIPEMLTVGFDARDGTVLWHVAYDEDGGIGQATSIGVSPDGRRVYVTGQVYQGEITGELADDDTSNDHPSWHYLDRVTVAYNAVPPAEPGDPPLGAELWVDQFDAAGLRDTPEGGLAVSPDGTRLFVTGYSAVGHTGADGQYMHYLWQTIAYDAATGQRVWRREHGTDGDGYHNVATALTVSPDGARLYVGGSVDGQIPSEHVSRPAKLNVVAYDVATGEELLDARFVPADVDTSVGVRMLAGGVQVQLSPDANTVYLVGEGIDEGRGAGLRSITTVAFDVSTGTRRWVARSSPGTGTRPNEWLGQWTWLNSENRQVAVGADGQLYVSGTYQGRSWAGAGVRPVRRQGDMVLYSYDTRPGASPAGAPAAPLSAVPPVG